MIKISRALDVSKIVLNCHEILSNTEVCVPPNHHYSFSGNDVLEVVTSQ